MKSIAKIITIFSALWLLLPIGSSAQNNAISIADSLFATQQYYKASVEFQRCGFYANSPQEKAMYTIAEAKCNMLLNKYEEVNKTLKKFLYANVSDSLAIEARIMHATTAYLTKDFEQALAEFMQLEFIKSDTQIVTENRYLKVLILNELKQFSEAEIELKKWINSFQISASSRDSILNWATNKYSSKNLPHLKSIRKAFLLASFLPGTGHFYCNAYKEGIVNMALMFTALAFTGVAVYLTYYVAGAVIGYGLFSRFQKGATHRMDFLVDKRNYEIIRPFNNEVKNKLIALKSKKSL